jgi:hypothetical protein
MPLAAPPPLPPPACLPGPSVRFPPPQPPRKPLIAFPPPPVLDTLPTGPIQPP